MNSSNKTDHGLFKKKKFLTKSFLKLNLNIFKTLLKILPNIKLRLNGFDALVILKKKYILLHIKILKLNSSFLFNILIDIAVIDYP